MKMVRANEPMQCVAASLAMAFNIELNCVVEDLFSELEYPFEAPFESFPKVPDMNQIVDWAWTQFSIAMIPFEYKPVCTPHERCKSVPVWKDGETMFRKQLGYGVGVIEVEKAGGGGHLVAWDGNQVFDPDGYRYDFEAMKSFEYEPRRFWLCT